MSLWVLKSKSGRVQFRFGWKGLALVTAGLIVLACAETSIGPPKSLPEQPFNNLPGLATGIQDGRLNFVPVAGSQVELQGMTNFGSWSIRSADIHGQIVLDTNANALNELFDRVEVAVPGDNAIPANLPMLTFRTEPIGDLRVPVMSLHGDSGGDGPRHAERVKGLATSVD